METTDASRTANGHQRLVFSDPAALRYLEEDAPTTVLERRQRLTGYQVYVIEQWACSRVHPTFAINVYTGRDEHSIIVTVLSVPNDDTLHSARLRVYLQAVGKNHARKRETPLGQLFVTNLSTFPSALTALLVPDGDMGVHRQEFLVNENLKRLGCSAPQPVGLAPPSPATQKKFRDNYRVSEEVAFGGAVLEMVKLCQVALVLYGNLAAQYADGLLCDVTEQALNDWWGDIGIAFFHTEPYDGVLGPVTVSAVLGLLMGARRRLNMVTDSRTSDAFDVESIKKDIVHFQQAQHLEVTCRLDWTTLERLHKETVKGRSDGWMLPRTVRTTVAELRGRGDEMVEGAVHVPVETLAMEEFIRHGTGERFEWLWQGRRRSGDDAEFGEEPGRSGFGRFRQLVLRRGHYRDESRTLPQATDVSDLSRKDVIEAGGLAPDGLRRSHQKVPSKGSGTESLGSTAISSRSSQLALRNSKQSQDYARDSKAIAVETRDYAPGTSTTGRHGLSRANSFPLPRRAPDGWEHRWPRAMSDSVMADIVRPQAPVPEIPSNAARALAASRARAVELEYLDQKLRRLETFDYGQVAHEVEALEQQDGQFNAIYSKIQDVLHAKRQEEASLRPELATVLSEERAMVSNMLKTVETLDAKLEYELQALQTKLGDMEIGLHEFERYVEQLEARLPSLTVQTSTSMVQEFSSWLGAGLVHRRA